MVAGSGYVWQLTTNQVFQKMVDTPCAKRRTSSLIIFLNKKLKNVSCEYDRVNGWNSTLQAAWYIRHLHKLSTRYKTVQQHYSSTAEKNKQTRRDRGGLNWRPTLLSMMSQKKMWLLAVSRRGPSRNRRSPSLAATPVLSAAIARAAVWVGHGAVARSRRIGWRSGLAAVLGVYYNRHVFQRFIWTLLLLPRSIT